MKRNIHRKLKTKIKNISVFFNTSTNFASIFELQKFCEMHSNPNGKCRNCPYSPKKGNYCPIGTPKYNDVESIKKYLIEYALGYERRRINV